MTFEERLRTLQRRVEREGHHFRAALAANSGIMEKAFTEMRLAFLALERSHSELSQLVAEERAAQEAILQDHEERLRRLEERSSLLLLKVQSLWSCTLQRAGTQFRRVVQIVLMCRTKVRAH